MKVSNIKPTTASYCALLSAYAKTGDIEKINETLHACKANCLMIPKKDLLAIMYEMAVNGQSDNFDMVCCKCEYTESDVSIVYCRLYFQINEILYCRCYLKYRKGSRTMTMYNS